MKLSQNEKACKFDDEMPLFCCNAQWSIVSINKSFEKLFPQIKVGMSALSFSDNNTAIFLNAKNRLSKSMPYFSTNFELLTKTMTIFVIPIETQTADLLSAVCSCFLEIGADAPVQAIYNITDSYRSPITDILNSSAVLAKKFEEHEDYDGISYVNHIVLHCYNMLKTTTTSQMYYKLLNSMQKVDMQKTNINEFLSFLCNTLSILFLKSEYSLSFSGCDEEIVSEIDCDLLSLAIFHLISNGCRYSPKGSNVNVNLSKSGDEYFTVTVSDTGDGIKSEHLGKIFEPYFTFNSTPVPEERRGVGLGLSIVKLISDLHGGTIFTNSKKNSGSSFSIRIPIKFDKSSKLVVKTDTAKYITNRFSNCYILFSDICDIKLY